MNSTMLENSASEIIMNFNKVMLYLYFVICLSTKPTVGQNYPEIHALLWNYFLF